MARALRDDNEFDLTRLRGLLKVATLMSTHHPSHRRRLVGPHSRRRRPHRHRRHDHRRAARRAGADRGRPRRAAETVDPATLDLVSPVTAPCRVVAQMTNFASHVKDCRPEPGDHPADLLPQDVGLDQRPLRRHRPPRPRALPGLRGRDRPGRSAASCRWAPQVTADNWTSFVAGLVVTNDVSARDVQLPKTQFFESKSYPTFTPVGPALVLLDDDELKRFGDLRLRLWVNGELRQDAVVDDDMIYPPLRGAAGAEPVPAPRRRATCC